MVVTRHNGLTVAEVTDLRRKMRAAGANFNVTKNRLARIALKGTQFENLDGLFKGPTAIAYSRDPVAAAKYKSQFPNIPLATVESDFGGWEKAQSTHFADGGVFDQIYQPGK